MNRTEYFNHLVKASEEQEKRLKEFRADLEKDPSFAFRWADSAFWAVARLEVVKALAASVAKGTRRPDIVAYLRYEVASASGHIENSSSNSANMLARCRLAALSQQLDVLLCMDAGANPGDFEGEE